MAQKTLELVSYVAKDSQRVKRDVIERVSTMFDDCADWTGQGVIQITLGQVEESGDREITVRVDH